MLRAESWRDEAPALKVAAILLPTCTLCNVLRASPATAVAVCRCEVAAATPLLLRRRARATAGDCSS
ncbi:MAG: hypothetical protein EOO41_03245, partial [Methanobacteriota archaeon]